MNAPIYTEFYRMLAKYEESHGIKVKCEDEDGSFHQWYLVPAIIQDCMDGRGIYVVVEHELKYPYTKWDFEEVVEDDLEAEVFGKPPRKPRIFCQASLVATPKMALMQERHD